MGQKAHPIGIRLGISKEHASVWYAEKEGYRKQLISDIRVRQYLDKQLAEASVSRITIKRMSQRTNQKVQIGISTARPGMVIGKKSELLDSLRKSVAELMELPEEMVHLVVEEIRKPDLDARLAAQNIAQQLKQRVMFRRAMRRTVQRIMQQGAKGVKVQVSGRLGGAEIARSEWYREGRVPLHTFRADIDYAVHEAFTTYGVLGVKVWIFRGENTAGQAEEAETPPRAATR